MDGYTAEEILEGPRDEFTATEEAVDFILNNHGLKRGEGFDDYDGENNLQDLLKWLGY